MKLLKELMCLRGRVALITGGSGHIGMAIAESLAELGASIVVVDRRVDSCQKSAEEVSAAFGVQTLPLSVDLADEFQVRSVAKTVQDKFGRLDILVNCAALVGTSDLKGWAVPFDKQSADTWRRALEINLTVPFLLVQECLAMLEKSRAGSVINVSSMYGMVGPDMHLYEGTEMGNPAAYAASKGGLLQLTRWMATVMAPKVRVNALTPGGVWRGQDNTFHEKYKKRTPLARMATEEDFKGAAAFLASDLSLYVTGQNIVVDGGWTVW